MSVLNKPMIYFLFGPSLAFSICLQKWWPCYMKTEMAASTSHNKQISLIQCMAFHVALSLRIPVPVSWIHLMWCLV